MKNGQIQKVIDILTPELKKRIVFSKLMFTGSKKFEHKNSDLNKSLYLIFYALNTDTMEHYEISYGVKDGYVSINMPSLFVKTPQK